MLFSVVRKAYLTSCNIYYITLRVIWSIIVNNIPSITCCIIKSIIFAIINYN